MKALKILLGLFVALFVVIAIVIGLVWNQLDSIVKSVIETTGTELTQTNVDVGDVNLTLQEGKGEIIGISIANPLGFSNNSVVAIGNIGLQLNIESLLESVKVIESVNVSGIALRAEQKDVTQTNIQALIDNLKSSTKRSSNDTTGAPTQTSDEGKPDEDVRLFIKSVKIGESTLVIDTEKWGQRTVTVPGYQQLNIGNRTTGSSPDQIGKAIIENLLNTVKKATEKELRAAAKAEIDKKLGEEKDKLEDKLKSLF